MPDPVEHHYPHTILRFGAGFELDLRQLLAADDVRALRGLGLGRQFGIVTPYNPRGVALPEKRNRWRWSQFGAQLRRERLAHLRADGLSVDRRHEERGFAIAAPRARLIALGMQWEQTALFWFDGVRFLLVPCRPRARGTVLPVS